MKKENRKEIARKETKNVRKQRRRKGEKRRKKGIIGDEKWCGKLR